MKNSKVPYNLHADKQNVKNKRAYLFDQESFLYLQNLAREYAGLNLQSNKEGTMYNRLVKRLRQLNLPDFKAYCELLKLDDDEKYEYINLIANPLTTFFREKHHFQFLQYKILPNLIAQKNRIRIWSAGCSTGEEPYSIAIAIFQSLPNIRNYDIKILATDVNTTSLEYASQGVYEADRIKHLSLDVKKSYFMQGVGSNEGLVKVNDKVRDLVSFAHLNLIDTWPLHTQFDIIFCRNVLIYFSKDVARAILAKFDDLLLPNGYLFLGYTESSFQLPKHYSVVAKTVYRKSLIK